MIVYGTGGHSKVISSILGNKLKYYFDDKSLIFKFNNIAVGPYSSEKLPEEKILICIGNNKVRKLITQLISHEFGFVKADSSIVVKSISVGKGSQLLHNCTIQIDTIIGDHVIVNTNASIDHDCTISNFVHIAPGSTLCGNVYIGEGTLIGAGSTILPGINIGSWCTIGAGSVVTKNIPNNSLAFGNPCRIVNL